MSEGKKAFGHLVGTNRSAGLFVLVCCELWDGSKDTVEVLIVCRGETLLTAQSHALKTAAKALLQEKLTKF